MPESAPAPVSQDQTGPSGVSGAGPRIVALVLYVFRACLPPKRLAILGLPCAATALTGLLARIGGRGTVGDFADITGVMIFGMALPLGALVIGDAVLGAEVRSGTLAFTWLTPARFAEIVGARWLGGWIVSLLSLVPAAALATVLAGHPGEAPALMVAVAADTAAHVAIFVAIGCITRRAAVWSLAFVFLVERLLGAVLSGIAQLSPSWEGQAVYNGLGGATGRLDYDGIPQGWDAVVRLGLVTAAGLAVAIWGLRRLQLTGSRD